MIVTILNDVAPTKGSEKEHTHTQFLGQHVKIRTRFVQNYQYTSIYLSYHMTTDTVTFFNGGFGVFV